MATKMRVCVLRLENNDFKKLAALARREHRSMTNYMEYTLLRHIAQYEESHGEIEVTPEEEEYEE